MRGRRRNVDEEWKWASAEVSPLQPSHSLPPTSARDENEISKFLSLEFPMHPHLFLSIDVEDLVADGLQVMDVQSVEVLPPPGPGLGLRGSDQIKLGQFAGQVDEGYGDSLWLPLQTQTGAQAVGGGRKGRVVSSPASQLPLSTH